MVFSEKKKFSKIFFFFCENEKLNYARFLGDFYYHGTMNVPCISEKMSIRNWVTFCGSDSSANQNKNSFTFTNLTKPVNNQTNCRIALEILKKIWISLLLI